VLSEVHVAEEYRRKFRRKHPNAAVLIKPITQKSVAKFRATGSVPDKMKTKKWHILTYEILDDIYSFRSQTEKVTMPISSSGRCVKIGFKHSNKTD
jgi:uncharacterized membrane protein YbaN (DUF454 family)